MQPNKDENSTSPDINQNSEPNPFLPAETDVPTSYEETNSAPEPDFLKSEAPADDETADSELTSAPSSVFAPIETKRPFFAAHKLLIIAGVIALFLFAAGAAGLLLNSGGDKESVGTTTQKKAVSLLGAEASVVDGVAEISQDGKKWSVLKAGDAVKVNSTVRTGADGRVVIAIDDGSALRVNNSSEVKIVSLAAKNIRFENESGEVYARVVPSDRAFVVAVGDETYTAKGTAYKTVNRETTKGVEVYHSAVAVGAAKTDVSEGKRYYQANADASLVKKTTDIPIDQLTKDAFLAWNLEQDKKTTEYANKLGYLVALEEKITADAKKAATPKPATTVPTSTAGIKLTALKVDTGIKLTWSLSGVTAEKGFKLLKSKTANPTYGVDSATYISSSTTRSYTWSLKDGKTYNFRVCTYTGESCTNYSNNSSATAPLVAASIPSGTLSLSQVGGKNIEWTLNGSAPDGYKVVWSTTSNPVYPGSSAEYYSAGSTVGAIGADDNGTYYVRVCMFTGSGCTNYSNQITITLP